MRSRSLLVVALILFQSASALLAQQPSPLELVRTIPLPGVKGRLDHLGIDERGKRLFVAGLENGSVEVLDLKKNVRTKSIPGFKKPQGIEFVPGLKKLFVASGDDGMLRVFRADTFELMES